MSSTPHEPSAGPLCRERARGHVPNLDRGRRAHASMLTILFDGIAYGMLLFVLACGLAVTLGLMNFVNLAHGAFAMAGGYVTVLLMERLGVPFLVRRSLAPSLPAPLSVSCSSGCSTVISTDEAISIRCCSRSASSSWRSPRRIT